MDIHFFSILGVGFLLGLRHALDADHLVAVSTLLADQRGIRRAAVAGAMWGAGHTFALLVAGCAMVFLEIRLSDRVAQIAELGVALMLIGLGVRVLWKLRRGALLHLHAHQHGSRTHLHPHLHAASGSHEHEPDPVLHHQRVRKSPITFLVGVVHGLAGSAGLMLIVLATLPTHLEAVLYILMFGFGSVGGMMLMSTFIAIPFGMAAGSRRRVGLLTFLAGCASVTFGFFLGWQTGVAAGIFF